MSALGWALIVGTTFVTVTAGVTILFAAVIKHERAAQREATAERKRRPIQVVR